MARRMILGEEHFLGPTFQRAPPAYMTLQGAQHAVGEALAVIVWSVLSHVTALSVDAPRNSGTISVSQSSVNASARKRRDLLGFCEGSVTAPSMRRALCSPIPAFAAANSWDFFLRMLM